MVVECSGLLLIEFEFQYVFFVEVRWFGVVGLKLGIVVLKVWSVM
jgi:hypothetical protein